MLALLRFIYDLPYDEDSEDARLRPYAMTYVVADEYQVKGLRLATSNKMKHIVDSPTLLEGDDSEASIHDFLDALTIIVTSTTTQDKHARKVMVEACTLNLQLVNQNPALLSLLRESIDLGGEIISHPDLECGLAGDWVCAGDCEVKCTVICNGFSEPFGKEFSRRNRDEERWTRGS